MIAILMSTYNGEKYVAEQIDSILIQSYQDWCLYIRDDGSIDNTSRIIDSYRQQYPAKIRLVEDGLGNLGAGFSFMKLLESIDADYYMFCDQDDVWLPAKIEKSYKKMLGVEKCQITPTPICIFSDVCVVNEDLSVRYESLWKSNKRNPKDSTDVYMAVVSRFPSLGCTMLMNRNVKDYVFPVTDFVRKQGGHDEWIAFIMAAKGIMDYVDEPLLLYRRHGDNLSEYEGRALTTSKVIKSLFIKPVVVVRHFVVMRKRLKLLPISLFFPRILLAYVKKWAYIIHY